MAKKGQKFNSYIFDIKEMVLEEYKENRPCRLAMASEIAEQTRGVLLFEEQQKKGPVTTKCRSIRQ